jgi:purine-binding chemotaxis protein CheW
MTDNSTRELIDWQTVWEQLDWDNAAHTEQVMRERLRQRAEQYAAPMVYEDYDPDDTYTLLTFELDNERYGIDVMAVRGVRTLNRLTRVPGVPSFYRGVVNVRGQVITVLDIRHFFNMPVHDEQQPNEIIIVAGNGLHLALLVGHVAEVITIPRNTIEPVEMSYARGVTTDHLVVLDIEKLLADERLIIGGVDEA